MKTFDKCCRVVGAIGVFLVALSFLYVSVVMVTGLFQLPAPPRILWAGLGLMILAMMTYVGVHLIRGDLFEI